MSSPPVVGPLDPAALTRYADVEQLVVDWLLATLGDVLDLRVSTELPAGEVLDEILADSAVGAYVQVEAFGGAEQDPASEVCRVDVDVYAGADSDGNPDRGAAHDVAAAIRAALLFHFPGHWTATATVAGVAGVSRPTARPYSENTLIRRFGAAYSITVKSRG